MKTELWAIGLVILATAFGSFGPLFLKKASSGISFHPMKIIRNKNLILGISFYAVATVIFIPALKGGDLSLLYPLVALTYVWVSLISMKFLNEKMNRTKWLGIALILVGVAFIGMGS
ncbi:EamA family transporter [Candidatus Woesearchaeota archaeon]|nr:EamA family transporter [Candidatus Woesearchaeota archaeon]